MSESVSSGAPDERRTAGSPAGKDATSFEAAAGDGPTAADSVATDAEPNNRPSRGVAERGAESGDRCGDVVVGDEPDRQGGTAGAVGGGREQRAVGGVGRGRLRRRDRGVALLAGVGVVLVLAAGGVGVRAAAGTGEPPIAGAAPSASEGPSAATGRSAPAGPTAVAGVATSRPDASWGPVSSQSPVAAPTARAAAGTKPLGVRIPAIGVDATSLVPLAIIPATGELAAPTRFDQTGWYAAGPVLGEPGPSVIAAHVDSRAGPAVFFRLKELGPGAKVYVPRSDGVTVTFTVTGVERYPKNAFPTQKVHGPTPDRALRLITCGGSFDYAKRSYRDNIVVYAVRTR